MSLMLGGIKNVFMTHDLGPADLKSSGYPNPLLNNELGVQAVLVRAIAIGCTLQLFSMTPSELTHQLK